MLASTNKIRSCSANISIPILGHLAIRLHCLCHLAESLSIIHCVRTDQTKVYITNNSITIRYLCVTEYHWGHLKNIHLHSCKHKTVTLKLTLTLTLTLTDTGGAVLGYRRLRIYKLKRKIQN